LGALTNALPPSPREAGIAENKKGQQVSRPFSIPISDFGVVPLCVSPGEASVSAKPAPAAGPPVAPAAAVWALASGPALRSRSAGEAQR
jgi:hypothetical protein